MASLDGLSHLIDLRLEAKHRRDEAVTEIEQIDAVLKQALGDDTDGMVNGVRALQWTHDIRREFNLGAFKTAHPGLYEEFRVERERRRLLFSEVD